jgi:trans-AT polyketide synthase/acyltransferase/oxidoreductase domain-containing protein
MIIGERTMPIKIDPMAGTRAIIFPGQGVQSKGMGKNLFHKYKNMTDLASGILGYDIVDLCTIDRNTQLNKTQYTQPAIYVVSAMGFYDYMSQAPVNNIDFLAGHSLGEYNALLAAEVFDFATGLRLVKKRGELMAAADGGAMAAVIGDAKRPIIEILGASGFGDIDVANFNSPTQTIIAGPRADLVRAQSAIEADGLRFVILNVSAPFHSRYMKAAQIEFMDFLSDLQFRDPKTPVIANSTGRPYDAGAVAKTLSDQIAAPVRWHESINYLIGAGVTEFKEIGSEVLTKMVKEISSVHHKSVAVAQSAAQPMAVPVPRNGDAVESAAMQFTATSLGSPQFRQRYGIKYAYVAGSMYRGIASPELVVRMSRAGYLSFFGCGGLSIEETRQGLDYIKGALPNNCVFGVNLLADYKDQDLERRYVDLFLESGIRNVEASAYMQVTLEIVRFRLAGLRRGEHDKIICDHRIISKISRPEVAEAFMSPPPEKMVQQLLRERRITPEQAEMADKVPVAHDLCVEADSGGHTDGGIPTVLLPTLIRLRHEVSSRHDYAEPICMGLAGGIGTPEAAAAAFLLGADFILTGSVNQCTVEAGTSPEVKGLLQEMNVQDTDYAPAGDMFEMGAKVQVLKRGVFFPARANKLFSLYQNYNSLDEVPKNTLAWLAKVVLGKTPDELWLDIADYLMSTGNVLEVTRGESDPRVKMAYVFKFYFHRSSKSALAGDSADRVNFQIHTGPALGAFNQWVKGTLMEAWTARHADDIAEMLMSGAAEFLQTWFARGVPGPRRSVV